MLIGVFATYYTNEFLNFFDIMNTCAWRPFAEVMLKSIGHWFRFFWEVITSVWNNIVVYLWSECLRVFWYDFRDWLEILVTRSLAVYTTGDSVDLSGSSGEIADGIAQTTASIGDLFMAVFDLPAMLFSLIECAAYFWTVPRLIWAVPTATFPDPTALYPAFFTELGTSNAPTMNSNFTYPDRNPLRPTKSPTLRPTRFPTQQPVHRPTLSPIPPTPQPTFRPTHSPIATSNCSAESCNACQQLYGINHCGYEYYYSTPYQFRAVPQEDVRQEYAVCPPGPYTRCPCGDSSEDYDFNTKVGSPIPTVTLGRLFCIYQPVDLPPSPPQRTREPTQNPVPRPTRLAPTLPNFGPTPKPTGYNPDYWSNFAYETNPRYGVYTSFFGGTNSDTGLLSRIANHVRRVLVALQNFVANTVRAVVTIIQMLRTAQLKDLWRGLIVSVDSELSLWRIIADWSASFWSIYLTALSPPTNYCGIRPETVDTEYITEYSHIRFAVERLIYRIFRVRIANVPRSISLIVYNLLTNKPDGFPLVDLITMFFSNSTTPSARLNLFAREQIFCQSYKDARLGSISGAVDTVVGQCAIWEGVMTPECEEWDGIDIEGYVAPGSNLHVAHLKLLVASLVDLFMIPGDIFEMFEILSCGDVEYRGRRRQQTYAYIVPRISKLLVIIVGDIPTRIVFLFTVEICMISPPVSLSGGDQAEVRLKTVGWIFIDYFLNKVLPITMGIFTGYDCALSQEFFTCALTQLSLVDPVGIFTEICQFVYGLIEYVIEGFLVGVQWVITKIADLVNNFCDFFNCDGVDWEESSIPTNVLTIACDLGQLATQVGISGGSLNYDSYFSKRQESGDADGIEGYASLVDTESGQINASAFAERFFPRASLSKQRRSAFDGNAAFGGRDGGGGGAAYTAETKQRVLEIISNAAVEHKEVITGVFYMKLASDARVLFEALERCYIGTESVPSQYTLCTQVKNAQDDSHAACNALTCARVAYECVRESALLRLEARDDKVPPNATPQQKAEWVQRRGNYFLESAYARPVVGAYETVAWILESIVCPEDSSEKTPTYLQSLFSVVAFGWDFVKRVKYISNNYAFAYYDCLDGTRAWAAEHSGASLHNARIIEHYVHCLEDPYVDASAEWRVPAELVEADDSSAIFASYLDSQQVTSSDGFCDAQLRKYGVLFDTEAGGISSSQLTYRICAYLHAYGTRSILATHIVAEHGVESFMRANNSDVRVSARSSDMWAPLPYRTVGNYLNAWRAPMSIMRSSEFLTTSLYDLFESYRISAALFINRSYALISPYLKYVPQLLRDFLARNYANVASFVRILSLWADLYDELFAPSDVIDRLLGRSERRFVPPSDRAAIAHQWYLAMRADVTSLLAMQKELQGRKRSSDDRSADTTAEKLYAAFKASGAHRRTERLKSIENTKFSRRDNSAAGDAPSETYDGFIDGWETYTVNLDNRSPERSEENNASPSEESLGDVVRKFSKNQRQRIKLQYKRERIFDAVKQPQDKFSAQSRPVYGDDEPTQSVDLQVVASHNRYNYSEIRIDVRVESDYAVATNRSATWTYVPYVRIDLRRTIDALQRFVESASSVPGEASAEDIGEAVQSRRLLESALQTSSRGRTDDTRTPIVFIRQFDQRILNGSIQLPSAAALQAQRQTALVLSLPKPLPLNLGVVASSLNAIFKIADRRLRLADSPPLQAAGMLVNALASNDPHLLSGWLEGTLGYVNGIGFVPRMYYEQYMQDVRVESENQLTPYARLAAGQSPALSFTSHVSTSFFAKPYAQQVREKYAALASEKNDEPRKLRRDEKLARRIENARIAHEQAEAHRMLHMHGHFSEELYNGNERTVDMIKAVMPRVYAKWEHTPDVNVSDIRRILSQTQRQTRNARDQGTLAYAVSVVAVSTDNVLPSLSEVVAWFDWFAFLVAGVEDVFTDFGQHVKLGVITGWTLFLDNYESLPGLLQDYLDQGVCSVPDDYAIDGTGTYRWSCLFQLYLPERAFKFMKIWPTNANNGDIVWSADAYVAGSYQPCVTTNGAGATVSVTFQPDLYCNAGNYIPIYDNYKYPSKLWCQATRDNSNNGHSRMCRTHGLTTADDDDDDGMIFCPRCEYCVREYNECGEYGKEPIRVLQVYTYYLGLVWNKIFNVETNMLSVSIFVFIYDRVIFRPSFLNVPPLTLFVLHGLFFSTSGWLWTAAFVIILRARSTLAANVFLLHMTLRKLWFYNYVTLNTVFDVSYGPDPFLIPYYDPIHAIGDLLNWISGLPVKLLSTEATVATYAPWLVSVANELRLFDNGGEPTKFEQLCSVFGLWSVILFTFLLWILFFLFGLVASPLSALVSLALAVLTFFVAGGIFVAALILSLLFAAYQWRKSRRARRADEILWERTEDENEMRKEENDELRETVEKLEEEDDEYRRKGQMPAKAYFTEPTSSVYKANSHSSSYASALIGDDAEAGESQLLRHRQRRQKSSDEKLNV
jgi:hypothetical protein